MTGRISDDELPAWRSEVAVSYVDGDPLFPFSLQTVGQQGEVDFFLPSAATGLFNGFQLIFKDGFAVV